MSNYFMCDGRRWQAPSIAPLYLATITPEKFAALFFALPVNKKQLGAREIKMLLTQCFIGMVDNRYGNGIQSVSISRERVMQKWKDDKFWGSKAIAAYDTASSYPSGASSFREASDRFSRGLPAPDATDDRRKDSIQAPSWRTREPVTTIDRGVPDHRDRRSDGRRPASPNVSRADELRNRVSRRLEDRVEDPLRQAPPSTNTAEKITGNAGQESASISFKRVKVEGQESPHLTRVEPLAVKCLPPGLPMSLAQNAGSENRPVANGQPYSPTTPHLNVNWPISDSSMAMEDSGSKGSGLSESPVLRRTGLVAQISSEQTPGGSLKRAREDAEKAHAAGEPMQLAPQAAEMAMGIDSVADGKVPGEIPAGSGIAGPTWTRPMMPIKKPESIKPIQAIIATTGSNSLPSPSETPKTTHSRPFAGFFMPDDISGSNGTFCSASAGSAPLTEKPHGKLPVSNFQKQRQSQPRSASTYMILLETLLRGAVKELEEPTNAEQIRAVTLLHGAVAELENLKNSLEGI